MSHPNKPTKPLRKYWTQVAQKALLGKKIIGIQYATKAQLDLFEMDLDGDSLLLITFDDQTTWTIASDDEFNGPGALHLLSGPPSILSAIKVDVLPVVPADE